MKFHCKKIMAIFAVFIMIFAMMPVMAASDNSIELTLYNDSVIPEGKTVPEGYKESYVWQMKENISNVFRLSVDMSFSRLYKAKDVELTINAFGSAGRNETIVRKSFGNESGVFKEGSADSGDIFAINTAPINGSASVSVTYQIKPEDIKDIGSLGKPLNLNCTLKAGSETVTSNTVAFTTDFSQGWSIINSGDHIEAYDEIEAFAVNEDAPLMHKERLKTVDGVFVDASKASESNYQWVEYRVPLLTDDPLGIYKHYIEIHVPDGCIFYSAQTDNEDAQVTPCKNLNYSVEKNTVTVSCADFLDAPHSADTTDSYYYFVMALDKSKYNNFNVVEFKEKHVHKDNPSIVVYSENTESLDLSFNDLGKYVPSTSNVFNIGIAMDDFRTSELKAFVESEAFARRYIENKAANKKVGIGSIVKLQNGQDYVITQIDAEKRRFKGEPVHFQERWEFDRKRKPEVFTKDQVLMVLRESQKEKAGDISKENEEQNEKEKNKKRSHAVSFSVVTNGDTDGLVTSGNSHETIVTGETTNLTYFQCANLGSGKNTIAQAGKMYNFEAET